jgi:hypothetical protein
MKLAQYIGLLFILFLFACEEEIELDLPLGEEMLVVQGHIEQGAPPLIVLTRTVPVFEGSSLVEQEARFVHQAQVVVRSEGNSYTLNEIPVSGLTTELKHLLSDQFAVPPGKLQPGSGFIFYVYTTTELKGVPGNRYDLQIVSGEQVLSATTTIPHLNPLDELFVVPHPDPAQDSLVSVYYRYSDPDTLGNSVRYFTRRNTEPFYAGLLSSVFNDELINGAKGLSFPLARGIPQGQTIDPKTAGYFGKGDTVTIRWASIDLPHFRFWSTLESERSSNGSPIGTPNITRSNIKGGLGIWGGYGVTYHSITVQ